MTWSSSRKHQPIPTATVEAGVGWSFRHPVDPPLAPRMPAVQARDAVYKVITEMHRTGALDSGNGDVADAWIESLRPQWLAHHKMVSAESEAAAQLAAGKYEAAAASARQRAEAQKAERDDTQRLLTVFENRLVAPNEAPAMDHPDRRRRTRPSLDSLEGLTHQWSWRVISIILLLAAAAGDFVNFRMVVAGVTEGEGLAVWVLTAAFAAAAVGVMHVAGRLARNLREGQGGLGRISLAVIMTAWAALGVAAFYVRLNVKSNGASTADDIFAGTTATTTGEDPLLSAILLAALYVGAGVLAFYIGFADHHPRMNSFLRLRRDLRSQREDVARAEQAAIEAERLAVNANDELARTAARTAAAESSFDAEIAELKELARIHIAGLIGEPAATNNLTTGRRGEKSPRPAGLPFGVIPMQGQPLDVLPASSNGNGNGHSAGTN